MGLSSREYVGRALDTLAASLGSYIASVLDGAAPGISWPKLLEHKDASAGRPPMTYSPADLSVQLRVMTEPLGSLGYPFNLTHDARSYASELRQTRNLWAHNEAINDADTFRALDTAGRLAKHLGLDGAAQVLSALLDSGVPLPEALPSSIDCTNNLIFQERLTVATEAVLAGEGFAEPLRAADVFPNTVIQMVRVGERTGGGEHVAQGGR